MSFEQLIDESAIRDVLFRYCRGIDRRDFDLVRACYHPDAYDEHGDYRGDVDGFIEHCRAGLARYEMTQHSISNILIDFSADRLAAVTEAYTNAFHRLPASRTKPRRDFFVALRYVDRFEKRAGQWAIAKRSCVFTWQRMEPIGFEAAWGPEFGFGRPAPDDPLYEYLGDL
ncbi:MAG: nuclear transport factor 2 family protein [Acidimicrobiia bacterium]